MVYPSYTLCRRSHLFEANAVKKDELASNERHCQRIDEFRFVYPSSHTRTLKHIPHILYTI